jgi:hypothetical protein
MKLLNVASNCDEAPSLESEQTIEDLSAPSRKIWSPNSNKVLSEFHSCKLKRSTNERYKANLSGGSLCCSFLDTQGNKRKRCNTEEHNSRVLLVIFFLITSISITPITSTFSITSRHALCCRLAGNSLGAGRSRAWKSEIVTRCISCIDSERFSSIAVSQHSLPLQRDEISNEEKEEYDFLLKKRQTCFRGDLDCNNQEFLV